MNPIPYGKQHISDDDVAAVVKALRAEYLTQGPSITNFENKFADYIGSRFAVAVSNGTAALHLSALAMGVTSGSNIITTPITFAASANCVKYCNGHVHFADIDPVTYCLDVKKVKELIESKPKGFFQGIVPVDFAGYAANMEAFRELAAEHGLWIIEDACHAPGGYFINSTAETQNCGNGRYSDLSIFSFHPVKHIACGEGGMITTNDETLYRTLMMLRTHGITKDPSSMSENPGGWYYEMQMLGYNYRLTDIQAALGISQLSRADEGLIRRKQIAANYFEAFRNDSFILGQSGNVEGHAYHLYIIEVENRLELYNHLRTRNIYSQIHYIPIPMLPYYKNLGYNIECFPVAKKYYEHCISLPMYPSLSDSEQRYVIDTIKQFYKGNES